MEVDLGESDDEDDDSGFFLWFAVYFPPVLLDLVFLFCFKGSVSMGLQRPNPVHDHLQFMLLRHLISFLSPVVVYLDISVLFACFCLSSGGHLLQQRRHLLFCCRQCLHHRCRHPGRLRHRYVFRHRQVCRQHQVYRRRQIFCFSHRQIGRYSHRLCCRKFRRRHQRQSHRTSHHHGQRDACYVFCFNESVGYGLAVRNLYTQLVFEDWVLLSDGKLGRPFTRILGARLCLFKFYSEPFKTKQLGLHMWVMVRCRDLLGDWFPGFSLHVPKILQPHLKGKNSHLFFLGVYHMTGKILRFIPNISVTNRWNCPNDSQNLCINIIPLGVIHLAAELLFGWDIMRWFLGMLVFTATFIRFYSRLGSHSFHVLPASPTDYAIQPPAAKSGTIRSFAELMDDSQTSSSRVLCPRIEIPIFCVRTGLPQAMAQQQHWFHWCKHSLFISLVFVDFFLVFEDNSAQSFRWIPFPIYSVGSSTCTPVQKTGFVAIKKGRPFPRIVGARWYLFMSYPETFMTSQLGLHMWGMVTFLGFSSNISRISMHVYRLASFHCIMSCVLLKLVKYVGISWSSDNHLKTRQDDEEVDFHHYGVIPFCLKGYIKTGHFCKWPGAITLWCMATLLWFSFMVIRLSASGTEAYFVFSSLFRVLGITTAFTSDSWGLLTAARLTLRNGWNNVWFEVDSKSVLQILQNGQKEAPWHLRGILFEATHIPLNVTTLRITHAYREANQAADELANEAVRRQNHDPMNPSTVIWEAVTLPFLYNILKNDRMGVTTPRVVPYCLLN